MINIILMLTFSIVLLLVMIYPAMKIVDFIAERKDINQKQHDMLTVVITIALSIVVGGILQFT